MSPEELQQHFRTVLDEVDAFIVAPTEPTFRKESGAHSIIDYFLVSSTLQGHLADEAVELAYGLSPHRAARITLRAPKYNPLQGEMKKPRSFPLQKPIGCPLAPVLPVWASAQTVDISTATHHSGLASPTDPAARYDTDKMWPTLCRAMEYELRRICDSVKLNGMADTKHSGHGHKLEMVKRCIYPMRASGPLGKVPIRAHALMWLHNRAVELAHFVAKVQNGVALPRASFVQWHRIMDKVAGGKGLSQTD